MSKNSLTYFKKKNNFSSGNSSNNWPNCNHADEFEYKKNTNELKASGNVEVIDKLSNERIFANSITYFKNKEVIFSSGNSKIKTNQIIIEGNSFELEKKIFLKLKKC